VGTPTPSAPRMLPRLCQLPDISVLNPFENVSGRRVHPPRIRAGSGGSIVRLIVPGAEVPIDVSSFEIDVDPAGRGHLPRLASPELDIVGQDAEIEELDLVPRVRREAGRWDDVVPHLPLAPVVADILRRHRL